MIKSGSIIGTILMLALAALGIATTVGVGYITGPFFKVQQKYESDKDEKISIDIDSSGIPAFNKIILVRIFLVLFWISVGFSILGVSKKT